MCYTVVRKNTGSEVEKVFLPWKLFSSCRGSNLSETARWPAKSPKSKKDSHTIEWESLLRGATGKDNQGSEMRKENFPRARKSCANFAATQSYWAGQKMRASLQRHSAELYINPFFCTVYDWVVMSCIYRVVLTCILIKPGFLQVKNLPHCLCRTPQRITWLQVLSKCQRLL